MVAWFIMEATLAKPEVWEHWREAKQLALVATFEDSITGTRVKNFCRLLSRHLGQKCRLIEHVWLFSTFRLPDLQQIAAEEASTADAVIISVHQARGLSDEVKRWIELWMERKGNRTAILLALLDPAFEGQPDSVRAYLQGVASRGNMKFVVESTPAPEIE